MTSNQIAAASQREQERHNARMETLEKQRNDEAERNNKAQNVLAIADNLNKSASVINQLYGNTTAYDVQSQQAATNAAKAKADREYYLKDLELKGYSQQEIKRHNIKLEELQLRDVKHLEYQDQLTQIRDSWNRDQNITENNLKLAQNSINATRNTIDAYLAQLERAKVNTETLRTYSQVLNDQVERELTQAKTNSERNKVVQGYMSSTGQLLKGISGLLVTGGF